MASAGKKRRHSGLQDCQIQKTVNLVGSGFGHICFFCCCTVLPDLAWVILDNVLHVISGLLLSAVDLCNGLHNEEMPSASSISTVAKIYVRERPAKSLKRSRRGRQDHTRSAAAVEQSVKTMAGKSQSGCRAGQK